MKGIVMITLYITNEPYTHGNKKINNHSAIVVESYHKEKIPNFFGRTEKTIFILPDGKKLDTTRTVSEVAPKDSIDVTNLDVLPFYVDLKEDLPGYVLFEPKRYIRAQLAVERRGLYQYYKHKDSEDLLLTAINSHAVTKYH